MFKGTGRQKPRIKKIIHTCSKLINNHRIDNNSFQPTFVIQSDHKKTPQLISFLFDIRFQRAIHQNKGFKKYYKLDIKCCP
jgi:hypothetical protein